MLRMGTKMEKLNIIFALMTYRPNIMLYLFPLGCTITKDQALNFIVSLILVPILCFVLSRRVAEIPIQLILIIQLQSELT